MEKRFIIFLILSFLIMSGYVAVHDMFAPPKPAVREVPQVAEQAAEDAKPPGDVRKGADQKIRPLQIREVGPADEDWAPRSVEQQFVSLGSADPDSPYRMLATLNNRGGSIERIELNERARSRDLRYRDLETPGGYLGHLALTDIPDGNGVRVGVVGEGTPAFKAAPLSAEARNIKPGLQPGDVIHAVNDQTIGGVAAWEKFFENTRPGQQVALSVLRNQEDGAEDAAPTAMQFSVTLTRRPLELIRPEPRFRSPSAEQNPLSFLFTFDRIGDASVPRGGEEIEGLPSLRNSYWETQVIDGEHPAVEFRYRLTENELGQVGQAGALEVVKRYRLVSASQTDLRHDRSYHLELELEIRNVGDSDQQFAYRLDGPNGLPLEGWWYSHKIHPKRFFSGAGARDVVWRPEGDGHRLLAAGEIYKRAKDTPQSPASALFTEDAPESQRAMRYVGVDTQYFAAVLLPRLDEQSAEGGARFVPRQAFATPVEDVAQQQDIRKTNVTFRLISEPRTLAPDEFYRQDFVIFAGPKNPELLAAYELDKLVEYGWFPLVAKPLSQVLHFFYGIVGNYGLAIILLTVLVRGCMFPLSRKAAKNAQMMQELAPEMKKIAEKYKNDMEKRAQAQRELFAKHNYNPFGGCLLMFLQLPIFIGLYRSLSVDIELRQAPLIPGLEWCSNLAGPDKFFYWEPYLPAFIAGEAGWLGPYLNILPLVTVALFLVHQKMFMPPATDDQTRLQQKMMSYMTIFIGILFFKVPSGLCVYFIASSLWGIAERKLLPKLPPPSEKQPAEKQAAAPLKAAPQAAAGGNGAAKRAKARRKVKRKR